MKDDLIISIIQQEWPLFNKTQNVGQRSFCQDQMANFIVSCTPPLSCNLICMI